MFGIRTNLHFDTHEPPSTGVWRAWTLPSIVVEWKGGIISGYGFGCA